MKEFAEKYLNLLQTEFKGLNLTRIEDPEDFYIKQVLDSILPFQQSPYFQKVVKSAKVVVDVGFGGGFPLLPLALENPGTMFLGVEARAKKVRAVQKIVEHLGLKNVKLLHFRLEELEFDFPVVITFKAVGKVKGYLKRINHSQTCHAFFYKGPSFWKDEKEELQDVQKEWEIQEERTIQFPQSELEGRLLLGFHAKNVPRGTSTKTHSRKNLVVKLSQFL